MASVIPPSKPRIALMDSLRGAALLGILLVHAVEHWDFGRYPENSSAWLKALDRRTHDTVFFLFSGKAYGIFALLFGVSFFLILDRWSARGLNVRRTFLWRLSVLAGFGYMHGIIFCGDVLLVIALLGLPLVFLYRLSNRTLAWISIALVVQIPSLWQVGQVLLVPGYQVPIPRHWAIYDELSKVYSTGTFFDVTLTNLWFGQSSRLWWTIETGRYCQMLGLFLWGILLGRSRCLEEAERCASLAKRALGWAVVAFLSVYSIHHYMGRWDIPDVNRPAVSSLLSSYHNLTQMIIWASGFALLYHSAKIRNILKLLEPYGRMSLTFYVIQGVIGVPVFYHYGLGLYQTLGAFFSAVFGAALAVVQCITAQIWLNRFHYGPLEWLWQALTFRDFGIPLQKRSPPPLAVETPA